MEIKKLQRILNPTSMETIGSASYTQNNQYLKKSQEKKNRRGSFNLKD